MVDLNLIYIFQAIYRARNLTRAAESLNISPAGVSAALRRLRLEYQDTLFIRKAQGVEPTVLADAIAEKLGMALALIEQAKKAQDGFDPSQEDRVFLIGMSDYSQAVILPSLLKRLRELAPGITLAVRHSGNETMRHALENGSFDLLIGNVLTPLGRIRQQQLFTEKFRGLVANTHPLAGQAIDVKELNKYPALLTEAHGNDRWWERQSILETGYAPTKIVSVPFFLGISLLLVDSPLVAITSERLSRHFCKLYPVTEIPLPFDDQPIVIRQYWHERWQNDPAHQWLRQTVHSVCQSLDKK